MNKKARFNQINLSIPGFMEMIDVEPKGCQLKQRVDKSLTSVRPTGHHFHFL